MSLLTAALATKIAAVLLATGVTVTGATAAVAYTGVLPDSLQQSAHDLIGAPSPTTGTETETEADDIADTETEDVADTDTDTDTPGDEETADPTAPGGPDATGSAAYGLCNAYAHGGLNETSTAYAALETTAGGADGIADYCATIPAHGKSAKNNPTETATPSPTGEPTDTSTVSEDSKKPKKDKPHKNK